MTMNQLRPGRAGTVAALLPGSADTAALLRLGLFPGAEVRCLRVSPLGDPRIYLLRGAVFAIRNRDAAAVRLVPEAETFLSDAGRQAR